MRRCCLIAVFALATSCDDVAPTAPVDRPPPNTPTATPPGGLVDDDGVAAPPACPALPPADDPLEVRTTYATVRGVVHDEGGFAWKAIRFGAPPVGERRFAPPAAPDCEDVVRDASADPPQCLQLGPSLDAVVGDEDCLFLNVFRPDRRDDDDDALPVLFWIHGGGQLLGSGHQPTGFGNLYDGASLAKEARAVVVSVNYRLGPLGFLAHPALQNAAGGSGNWAHHDVLAALRWTKDNIAGFGGDPARVTIFGESAGAHNVCVLLASPLARGLFHGAIAQSGGCDAAPLDVRQAEGEDTAAAVGCGDDVSDVAACLRAAPAPSFMRTVPPIPPLLHVWRLPWGTTLDGEVLTEQPLTTIERGAHNAVPAIVGSNRDETMLFIGADTPITCFDLRLQLELMLQSSFSSDTVRDDAIDRVLETYACGSRFIVKDVLIEASTDLEFTCHARRLTRALTANQTAPVYRYHFRDRANYGAYAAMGAFHAWELAYVFDGYAQLLYLPSSTERALGRQMQRAWGRLAASGDPNHSDLPPWRPSHDDSVMAFDEDPFANLGGGEITTAMDDDPSPSCDLWDALAVANP